MVGRRIAAALLAVVGAGCTSEPQAGPASLTATESSAAIVERPHFEGSLPVRLRAGTTVYLEPPCRPDPARGRICSIDGAATYLTYPPGRRARLVEASMEPNDESTEWIVTLTFDSAAPRPVSRQALQLGGALLVISSDKEVLVAHRPVTVPVHSVRGRVVHLKETDKATAWGLVESLVDAV